MSIPTIPIARSIWQRGQNLCGAPLELSERELAIIDGELDEVLCAIRNSEDLKAAEPLLQLLNEITALFALMWYGHCFQLTDRQADLVRDCDRLDLYEDRRYVYEMILANRYSRSTLGPP
jgi:hypothetical protein